VTVTDTPGVPVSCGPLRERADALDLLASHAQWALNGAGSLVLLRGATGTGRTAVLEAAAANATEQGLRVLRARCWAEDAGFPLASLFQFFDPTCDMGCDVDPHEAGRDPVAPARLWRQLRSYAADSPLLLAVDDVHLADPASRRWLNEVARRLDRLPVLLVATERGQYDIAPPKPGLAHGLSPSLVRTHALAPLSRAAATDIVRSRVGARASEEWVDDCVQAGAGNPLLLRALLDDLRTVYSDGSVPETLPESSAELYPGAFAAAVSWWLDAAGPATTGVARTLAELEDGQDVEELLAEVAGADPARVSGWLTAMLRLGLLRRSPAGGGPRFAHPLLREAVLDGLAQPDRQAGHLKAAQLRHRRGAGVETVAEALLQAPPVGAAWAADALLDAALQAIPGGRTDDAAEYLRRALDEPMPRERRVTVLSELGSLEFATGSAAGIPRLAEAMRLQEHPRERVKAAVSLGTALAYRGEANAGARAGRPWCSSTRPPRGWSRQSRR
jgi:hypothetical protein